MHRNTPNTENPPVIVGIVAEFDSPEAAVAARLAFAAPYANPARTRKQTLSVTLEVPRDEDVQAATETAVSMLAAQPGCVMQHSAVALSAPRPVFAADIPARS